MRLQYLSAYYIKIREVINNWALSVLEHSNEEILRQKRIIYWNRKMIANATAFQESDLSFEQIKQVYDYYSFVPKINVNSHRFYTKATGVFDKKYLPDDIFFAYIDPYFNQWDEAVKIDNKAYYRMIFNDIKQPETVVFRCGNLWFERSGNQISYSDAVQKICSYCGVFLKRATESEGGHGVFYLEDDRFEIESVIAKIDGDIVVQVPLRQHPAIGRLNPNSVNTIRIISLLTHYGVKPYSSVLRIGVGESKVDNASSGGITCGIEANGRLKAVAYSNNGTKFLEHPTTGIKFDTVVIPSFDKAIEMVKYIHLRLPHFKLISWDIAIDENEDPVLIEANLRYGEIDFHQLNNGPLFGDDTDEILSEVFNLK